MGNAKQSALYYQHCFGYELIVYKGPETGSRDVASYVLQQGKIRLVLTSTLKDDHEIARHVAKHGDGVKVLALWVDNAAEAYEKQWPGELILHLSLIPCRMNMEKSS